LALRISAVPFLAVQTKLYDVLELVFYATRSLYPKRFPWGAGGNAAGNEISRFLDCNLLILVLTFGLIWGILCPESFMKAKRNSFFVGGITGFWCEGGV
jgi:hypothetical protein